MAGAQDVAAFIEGLSGDEREITVRLRALALASRPDVTEHIKWNAPSFCIDGDDRITLGIERNGGVRAVLHRGAKVKDAADFAFADPGRLASWPRPDRGVMTFTTVADVADRESAISDIFTRWLDATAQGPTP